MRCSTEIVEAKLRDLLSFIVDNRGKTPPSSITGKHELIEINAIASNGKYPKYSDVKKYVDQQTYDGWFRKGHPQVGDILIPTVGTLDALAYVNENRGCIAQNLIAIRADEKICNSQYLYYMLCNPHFRKKLLGLDIGGVQPSIKVPHLLDMDVCIPMPTEQKAIAAVLSALDDKIELNNRINKNLEAQAQAIFSEWILNNHNNSIGVLSDIADINPHRKLSKGVPAKYIEMSNLTSVGSFPAGWEEKEYNGGVKFQNGDTLLARITPCLENGKGAYVNFLEDGEIAFGSTEYIVITGKAGVCNELFYFLIRHPEFRTFAAQSMTGSSGRQRASAEAISKYAIPIPTKDTLKRFGEVAATVMMSNRVRSFENRTLAALRDTLLPKLMSGEIRVPLEV